MLIPLSLTLFNVRYDLSIDQEKLELEYAKLLIIRKRSNTIYNQYALQVF